MNDELTTYFMKHFDTLSHIFLLLGFVVGIIGILKMRYEVTSQFLIILALAVFYLLWGVVYHDRKKDLTLKLFLEYFLLASIATVVGFLVFLR